jgi:hypothetical protein
MAEEIPTQLSIQSVPWVLLAAFSQVFLGFFAVLGFELQAYTLSHSISPSFVTGFLNIGSLELIVWAGFQP